MRNVLILAMILVGGCTLYGGDDQAAPVDAAAVPAVDAAACPVVEARPCPPSWPSCQAGWLRQGECRALCQGGAAVCAGATVPACVDDCNAYRYDVAFCLAP